MDKLLPRRVKKQAGLNPVARAVARENLKKAVLDQKIQLYLLEEGAQCTDAVAPVLLMIMAFLVALEHDKNIDPAVRERGILKGAASACDQMLADGVFRRANLVTLDLALDCAVTLSRRVDPSVFNEAWKQVSGNISVAR